MPYGEPHAATIDNSPALGDQIPLHSVREGNLPAQQLVVEQQPAPESSRRLKAENISELRQRIDMKKRELAQMKQF